MRRQPDHAAAEAGRLLLRYSPGPVRAELELKHEEGTERPLAAAELLEVALKDHPELAKQLLGECAAGENTRASETARTIVALDEGARATAASSSSSSKKKRGEG